MSNIFLIPHCLILEEELHVAVGTCLKKKYIYIYIIMYSNT